MTGYDLRVSGDTGLDPTHTKLQPTVKNRTHPRVELQSARKQLPTPDLPHQIWLFPSEGKELLKVEMGNTHGNEGIGMLKAFSGKHVRIIRKEVVLVGCCQLNTSWSFP